MPHLLYTTTILLLTLGLLPSVSCAQIILSEHEEDEGQAAYKIETERATYFYQPEAGAFSSMIDNEGHDWISFNRSEGPKGMYRGIPNLVFPGDIFHPGYQHCRSEITKNTDQQVSIQSTSNDNEWSCTWDIYPTYATLTVTQADSNYWFLYEGTPGGSFSEEDDYYVTSDGKRRACSEPLKEQVLPSPEWVYFGDRNTERTLFLLHHTADEAVDQYYPMDGMTVWGFGRNYQCCEKYLEDTPNRFTIGFVETDQPEAVQADIREIAAQYGQ